MKSFASLHTSNPSAQSEYEADYAGYSRVEIDHNADFAKKETITVLFPKFPETVEGLLYTHVMIASQEDGKPLAVLDLVPNIPATEGLEPTVIFANIPEPLPESLHPLAAAIWHSVNIGELDPATFPPAIFEQLNIELEKNGVEIFRVVREGAADMTVKMSQMKSMKEWGNA